MTTATMEKREQRCAPLELRATDDDAPVLEGYAAVFDSESEDLGGFTEVVRSGAFTRTLKESRDIKALVGHDDNRIIGRTTNKTLELRQDDKGLKVRIFPPDTSIGRDLVKSVKRGDIDQMSFGFRVVEQRWTERKDDERPVLREILDVDLFEVSAVVFPAYKETVVESRGFNAYQEEQQLRARMAANRAALDRLKAPATIPQTT